MSRKRRGRDEGSIFQRANGSWVAEISAGFHADGRRRRLTAYGATKREAQDRLAELRAQAGNDQAEEAGKLTLQAFLARWLATAKGKPARGPTSGTTLIAGSRSFPGWATSA